MRVPDDLIERLPGWSGPIGKTVCMPELSRFLGIVIGIFPREYPPSHFHAVYGEHQITVDIQSGIVHGDFPKRALRLVLDGSICTKRSFLKTGI